MQQLESGAVAQPQPELAEATGRQPVSRWQPDLLVLQSIEDVSDPPAIVGIALEIPSVRSEKALVCGAVDVIDRSADRRQATRDERLREALGRRRQVGHRREAAEALPEDAPALDAELL